MVKDSLFLLVISWMQVVTRVRGSGFPGRHVQVHLLMSFRIQGIQRRGDGKDCAPPPSSEGEGSEVGVPRNLFPRLGVGDILHPGTPGTCSRRHQAWWGSSRRDQCTGTGPFKLVAWCTRMDRHACATHCPHHHHHHHLRSHFGSSHFGSSCHFGSGVQ